MVKGHSSGGSRRFKDLRCRHLDIVEDRELIRPPGALDVQRRNARLVLESRMQRYVVIVARKTLPPAPHPEAPRSQAVQDGPLELRAKTRARRAASPVLAGGAPLKTATPHAP